MSNRDLLKLENEYRDQLIKYKEKPKIGPVTKPDGLTNRISSFLNKAQKADTTPNSAGHQGDQKPSVEMDIYLTPSMENDDDDDDDQSSNSTTIKTSMPQVQL